MRAVMALILGLGAGLPAHAQRPEDGVRAVIADWYQRVGQRQADRPEVLMAPGGIDGGPGYAELPTTSAAKRSAAAWTGPRINNELGAKALTFRYDVDVLNQDAHFAKAMVWERGYFYAWSAQQTYEMAALAMFVLEKQPDGRWLILAHEAHNVGIPPGKITAPMPDLHDVFYATEGQGRDPIADAQAAKAN